MNSRLFALPDGIDEQSPEADDLIAVRLTELFTAPPLSHIRDRLPVEVLDVKLRRPAGEPSEFHVFVEIPSHTLAFPADAAAHLIRLLFDPDLRGGHLGCALSCEVEVARAPMLLAQAPGGQMPPVQPGANIRVDAVLQAASEPHRDPEAYRSLVSWAVGFEVASDVFLKYLLEGDPFGELASAEDLVPLLSSESARVRELAFRLLGEVGDE